MTQYKPIEDYALVGDCAGCALVASNGDIDWCALGRFDAEPMLFPILDHAKGGTWSIRVEGARVSRSYEHHSNVLRTVYETDEGRLVVKDFMPVGRRSESSTYDYVTLNTPGWMVRRLRVARGTVDVEMRFTPGGGDWARRERDLSLDGRSATIDRAGFYADGPLELEDGSLVSRERLAEGDIRHFTLTAKREHRNPSTRIEAMLATTRAFWTEWAEFCRYGGAHEERVMRSALVLKLLTYSATGALVAAATTSLPEDIGGVRNWDYRYCWIRDSALSLYALSAIGYSGEAHDFAGFITNLPLPRFTPLQIMYGIHGERELAEEDLDHLEGYEGSKPVRIGNGAYDQVQIDVYGEIIDLMHVRAALGHALTDHEKMFIADVADEICHIWRSPDASLWEARSRPRHYAHSKFMAWVGLDRAIDLLGEREDWVRNRDAVLEAVREGAGKSGRLDRVLPFEDDPGGEGADASLLLAPAHGLPLTRDELDATVRGVEADLRHGDFVHRYDGEDGLPGEEGAFLICSFWLVDALLMTDRGEEAEALFDSLCGLANDVGLFAEEADPETRAHLGNMPQAFTHLALVASAVNLELWREGGTQAVLGNYGDRAKRASGHTEGLRGIVETALRKGSVRVLPSKDSVLEV